MEERIPKHIAVIPDGNRRYSQKTGMSLLDTYWASINNCSKCVEWFQKELGIPNLSIYALSYDNVAKRKDLMPLYKLQTKMHKSWIEDKFFKKHQIKVKFVGELSLFPSFFVDAATELEESTKTHTKHKLYLLYAYSGRMEIIKAAQEFASKYKGPHSESTNAFYEFLSVQEPVDLLIRTAYEHRISDCLPYQAAYSEFIFLKKCFPEITKEDMVAAIWEYKRRKRSFGV